MAVSQDIHTEQILNALKKPALARSYDDLLLLKSYISKTEFITKDLHGVVNPRQMNDICRSLILETFNCGEAVFNQGDNGEKVYIILTGRCEVKIRYRLDLTQGQSEIREKSVGQFSSGQFFGERALKFDEPRSATVICIEDGTNLFSLHKSIYLEVLEEAKREELLPSLRPEQIGTKEGVIRILGKVREKRSPQELDAVASYLYRRIPFFQKFAMHHLIELCRVADSITIWGRSILFKQGQIGQAFYVILTGTVEVWVQDPNNITGSVPSSTRHLRANDLTDGLGAKVNQLVTGDVFGERALENETSQRMASIITGEDNTELIVISKEDYHNLVYVMMHSDSMHKLQVLRRTELFHSLDIVHLRALSRFMEPRKYQIDEEIQTSGKKATELIIIEKGECRVITEIQEGYEKLSAEQKYQIRHRRYMEKASSPSGSPRHENPHPNQVSTSIIPSTPKHGGGTKGAHNEPVASQSVEQVHKLLRHKPYQTEENEVLDTSKKELRKKSLMFEEKLKESLGIAEGIMARPNSEEGERGNSRRGNRFKSMDMNLLGRRKKIDLGRIAPNSILSASVLGTDNPHQDAFHPETVIAASLVTAYTIGKHDFFNHMPKDSLEAIVKVIREYKPPVLNPLWENAPRVLDENQWKMEKVWERFKNQVSQDIHKDFNILDAYKVIQRRHISASSGNDPNQKYVSRMDDWGIQTNGATGLGGGGGMRSMKHGIHKEVDINWGKPEISIENLLKNPGYEANNYSTDDQQIVTRLPFGGGAGGGGNGGGGGKRLEPIQTNLSKGSTLHHEKMENIIRPVAPSAAILTTVSNIIRNRINRSQSSASIQENIMKGMTLSSPSFNPSMSQSSDGGYEQTIQRALEVNERGIKSHLQHSPSSPPRRLTTANSSSNHLNSSLATFKDPTKIGLKYPFSLIHVHREVPHANPIQFLGEKRRLLKSYLRVNGIFKTCAKAKQMADTLMEQLFITLYHSTHLIKENELVLQWNTFKGYESIDVHDTDLFFIYCRSIPIEFASLKPSKNIFNAKFPSLCKPIHQRFAVLVMNEINEKQTIQQGSRANTSLDTKRNEFFSDLTNAETHDVYRENGEDDSDEEKNAAKNKNNPHSRAALRQKKKIPVAGTGNSFAAPSSSFNANNNNNAVAAAVAIAANAGNSSFSMNNNGLQINTGANNNNGNNDRFVRRTSEFSSNDLTQLKVDLMNNGLNVNDFLVKKKSSMSSNNAMPLYLKEVSIVYEVITVTSTRMDSVRYAIHRFGSIERTDSIPILNVHQNQQQQQQNQNQNQLSQQISGNRNSPSKTLIQKSVQNFVNTSLNKVAGGNQRRPISPSHEFDPHTLTRVDSASGDEGSGEDEDLDESPNNNRPASPSAMFFSYNNLNNNPSDNDSVSTFAMDNPFLRTRLYLKAFDSTEPDRILKLILTDNKRICILPLFKWILINEETLDTLNFLNIFDEASIKKIYLAEELENLQEQQALQQQGGGIPDRDADKGNPVNDYTDIEQTLYDKSVDPALIKSFSEAGLLPVKAVKGMGSTQGTGKMSLSQSMPEFYPSEKTKALEILQNEMLTRELSTTVHHLKDNMTAVPSSPAGDIPIRAPNFVNNVEGAENGENGDASTALTGAGGEVMEGEEGLMLTNKSGAIIDLSELQVMSAGTAGKKRPAGTLNHSNSNLSTSMNNSSNNNGNNNGNNNNNNNNNNHTTQKAMLIEQRLKALNSVAGEQMKIVGAHEKLLVKESREIKSSLLEKGNTNNGGDPLKRGDSGVSEVTDPQSLSAAASPAKKKSTLGGGGGGGATAEGKKTLENPPAFNPFQQQNTARNYELMKERLNVIESLQKINPPAKDAFNPPEKVVPQRPNAYKRYLQPPGANKESNKDHHHNHNKANHQPENTVAGKRLAESLRLLSDTLDAQYKK